MFSTKLITALTLVLLAINAAEAITHGKWPSKRSQCSVWRAKGNKSSTPKPITAKLMSAAKEKLHQQAASLRRRNTPPKKLGSIVSSDTTSVCDHKHGYDSEKRLGVCLWTGEHQWPKYSNNTFYPGWLNYKHPENCDRKLWLIPGKGDPVYAPVIDGCAFGTKDKPISVDDGCATVWVTELLFKKLGGKKDDDTVTINSWDFEAYDAPGN
ncbi:hypothetical protein MJO29_008829 [Puccinia striiformis f. sp. tritici]|nr:hypothetical protein MJO29_008829 [Puccinia striiformis f. sp. tritici]